MVLKCKIRPRAGPGRWRLDRTDVAADGRKVSPDVSSGSVANDDAGVRGKKPDAAPRISGQVVAINAAARPQGVDAIAAVARTGVFEDRAVGGSLNAIPAVLADDTAFNGASNVGKNSDIVRGARVTCYHTIFDDALCGCRDADSIGAFISGYGAVLDDAPAGANAIAGRSVLRGNDAIPHDRAVRGLDPMLGGSIRAVVMRRAVLQDRITTQTESGRAIARRNHILHPNKIRAACLAAGKCPGLQDTMHH